DSDDEFIRIRMKGCSDELLVDLRSISVGSNDQRDAELDGAPEHHPGRIGITGPAPYAWPTQSHSAEANSGHGQVPTDREGYTKALRCLPDVVLRLGTHAFLPLNSNSQFVSE